MTRAAAIPANRTAAAPFSTAEYSEKSRKPRVKPVNAAAGSPRGWHEGGGRRSRGRHRGTAPSHVAQKSESSAPAPGWESPWTQETFATLKEDLDPREGNKGPGDGRPVRRRSDPLLISLLDPLKCGILEDPLNRSRQPVRISRFCEHEAGASLQLTNRMDAGRHDGQPGRDRLERDERQTGPDETVRENRDVRGSIGGAQFLA